MRIDAVQARRRLPAGAQHARRQAGDRLYTSTRAYQAVLAVHGLDDLVPYLRVRLPQGDWCGMADPMSHEMLDRFAAVGGVETRGARIREPYAGLDDRARLCPTFQPPSTIRGSRGA